MTKFTSNNLMKDESIVYSTKLHWIVYLQVIPFFFLALVSLIAGPGILKSLETKSSSFFILGIMLIIGGLLDILYFRILIRTSEFVITNKRLIMKRGIISTKTLELLHSKIETVSIFQGIGGKIFGYGNLAVVGSGGTVNLFKTIEKPFDFRKAAQEAINKAQKTA